jgi:hypothetical protein
MKNVVFFSACQLSFLFILHFPAKAQVVVQAASQAASRDSTYEHEAYTTAVRAYHRYLGAENGLYNGGEYADYSTTLTSGQPYFGPIESQPGWIVYNGVRYDNLQLWYDLVTDAVVVNDADHVLKIQLINDRLQSFSLSGHLFLRVLRDSIDGVRTGFYELLDGGRVNLFKRSGKSLQVNAMQDGLHRDILSDSSYFIEKNGHFLSAGRKSSILNALSDKKPAVKSYMRKNNITSGFLRLNKDEALLKIVAYYNGLTP